MAKSGGGGNWGTLIPRFLLAVVFIFHGGQKLFGLFDGDGIDGLVKAVTGWGWPMPGVLARAAAATEFFGGICLGLGLLTRFWGLGLATVMGVGIWKVHWESGFGGPKGFEYPLVLGVLALSLAVQGGGALSMDEMFFKGKKAAAPKPEE